MAKRTREQLNSLRKVVGGSLAAVGFLVVAMCVMFNLANVPLVITGFVLLVAGGVIAASVTVFEAIIQLVSSL